MDIITYGKVVKLSNEIKEAREDSGTLDSRLDKIALGTITTVNAKTDLPPQGKPEAIYAVLADESNQSMPTLYMYGEEYTRLMGSDVSYKSNGILTVNGLEVMVYEHPDFHSADMISDGDTHVSMTWGERKRLNVMDPWESISDLVDYTDVVTYFAFDVQGRVIRQVVTDNYTEQLVREPVLTMPASPEGYAQDDSFLVISIGEIYRYDGLDFVQLPTLVDVIYQYDDEGRLVDKSITRVGTTPIQTNFKYIYDSYGNRIAVKKY
ncbi:hypothetical protein [Paenibacillus sp. 2KB_22]|uniref:hypothetical protein n=1 Tax=Paenibacillus sp. 2KB_22 TaxID=3232978 RepID=UPI003F985683